MYYVIYYMYISTLGFLALVYSWMELVSVYVVSFFWHLFYSVKFECS